MAQGDQGDQAKPQRQTKAERRQARAGGQGRAGRKQARAGRKRGGRAAAGAVPDAPGEDASPEERIEWRLARVEAAVAAQSERTDELLEKVDATLRETPESATQADQPEPDDEGD
jgi:hypothetical protein